MFDGKMHCLLFDVIVSSWMVSFIALQYISPIVDLQTSVKWAHCGLFQ